MSTPRPARLGRPARTPAARLARWLLCAPLVLLALLLPGCANSGVGIEAPAPESAPAGPATITRNDVDAWLDGLVPTALDRAGIPGATVSVVHDGRLLTARGFGQAKLADGDSPAQPVDPAATLFRVGSVSKLFTATAVMQQVELGRLDLDTDVNRYLDFTLPEPRGTITLRTLLTHTAGFEERARPLIEAPSTPVDLRSFVATDPPEQVFAPGTVPAYSNYSNSLAGYIVQRVSGQPFADYVQHHILDRIGMRSASFAQPLPAGLAGQLAGGYRDDQSPAVPFETVAAAPAGALSASGTDMARFMLAQLGDLPAGQRLLAPSTLALMHRPATSAATLGTLASGPRMTLGLFDESRNGQQILGHEGDTTVFHSDLEIYPQADTGIFISMNGSGHAATDAHELRVALMRAFTDRYFPKPAGTTDAAGPTLPTAQSDAAAAAGRYESSRSGRRTFLALLRLQGQTTATANADGTLTLTPGAGEFNRSSTYREVAPATWREVGGDRVISTRAAAGRVDAIGFDNAFTLLRTGPGHDARLVLPLVAGAELILLLAALGWPVAALLRRHYGQPRRSRPGGLVVLRRIGIGATLAALVGWAVVIIKALGTGSVPDAPLRVIQAVQLVGVLGVLPAAGCLLVAIRSARGWRATLGSAVLLVALGVMAWFAFTFRLIAPSVSY